MRRNGGSQIGFELIAIALLAIALSGAVTMQAAVAEDVGPVSQGDAKSSGLSAEPDSAKPPSGGDAASVPADRNSDGIDTRISVQPHRTGDKPNKIGETKPNVPPAAKNPHRRIFSTLGSSNRTGRNSIGVPIGQREDAKRRDNGQFDSPVGPRIPANITTTETRTPTGNATKIEGQIARPAANVGRPTGWRAANQAMFNGAGPVHRVPNSSGIGGPSTATAGISGTSIRPKR